MEETIVWEEPKETYLINKNDFPIDCLPEAIKQYSIALAEELQVSVDMVASSILGILSLCNQGKYYVEGKKGWKEPVNLYILVIAQPAERKSPIFNRLLKVVYDYEKKQNLLLRPMISDYENKKDILTGQIENIKRKIKGNDTYNDRNIEDLLKKLEEKQFKLSSLEQIKSIQLIADDITPEALASIMTDNKGKMGIFSSEGGIFATINGRYSNNIPNCDIFLKSYSGDYLKVNRKGCETETIEKPAITMLIFIQPILIEYLIQNIEFKGKGLCARFMYCYPESKIGTRDIESKAVDEGTEEKYNTLINTLLNNKESKILKLTEEAYAESVKFAKELEPKLINELEGMEDWAGKFHGLVLRIAGNLHMAKYPDGKNDSIDEETFKNAIQIGEYYLKETKKIYNMTEKDLESIKAKKILSILKRKGISGTIKRHDLFRKVRCKEINEVKDINEPVKILIELGYIKEIINESKGVGRKPDSFILLNPKFFE